ncbi:MAG: Abi family protein, partial [Anaerolineae bacterium]|nr:Abi family protein [Anaerolineae bacterium]
FLIIIDDKDIKKISHKYNIQGPILKSWVKALHQIRNICAHHGRVWNNDLRVKPLIPHKKNNPEFYFPNAIGNQKVFAILTIINYLLIRINPQIEWGEKVMTLFNKYPNVPKDEMGFPDNWNEFEIWQLNY